MSDNNMNQKAIASIVPFDLTIDPTNPDTWPVWISVPEAALILRLSVSTIRFLSMTKALPFRKFGRQVRIHRDDLLEHGKKRA